LLVRQDPKYLCRVKNHQKNQHQNTMLKSQIIGNKITEARKKAGISQAQLAQRLSISPQAVGKWERGESMPDIITFNRLAEMLGVDLNYFSENFQSTETAEAVVKRSAETPAGKAAPKRSWDMSRGNLEDIDFSGLNNLHENFSSSNIQRCLFVGADLTKLLLKNNNIDSCDFSGADLRKSQIQTSNLTNNLFKNCNLQETEFVRSYVEGCDFSGADLSAVAFSSGGFGKNTVANTIWKGTSFQAMHLADMVFEGTLEDCFFENCAFSGVTFQNAILVNTFFKNNRKLKQVKFVNCQADKLTYAFLKSGKADLAGVTLI
jgi:uncharacterized protein YjbI with pentapeptide repeats